MAYVFDDEIEALAEIWEKVKGLDAAALDRIIDYLTTRHAEQRATPTVEDVKKAA